MLISNLRRSRSGTATVEVDFDDGSVVRVNERRVIDLGLVVGTVMDATERASLERWAAADAAEQRMVRLIARRGRSRHEICDRLEALGVDAPDREEIIARFERLGLVDDTALAEAVLDQSHRRGHGRMRVDDDLSRLRVASVVEHDAEGECERARAVVLKRFGEIPSASADLSRAVAYLQRRGYDEDTIRMVLRLPDE